MNRKLIVSLSILLAAILCEFLLWKQTILISFLLILLAYIKHRLYPIKKEGLWYGSICVVGALVEIMLVHFGHAWRYSSPHMLGIPVWIPLFWGVIGTTIIVAYDGLTKGKR